MKITTFNILAQVWVNPGWYPGQSAYDLSIEQRLPLIIRTLKELDSDVICLQEVTSETYSEIKNQFTEYHFSELSANNPTSAAEPNGTMTMIKKSFIGDNPFEFEYRIWDKQSGKAGIILHYGDMLIINSHLAYPPKDFIAQSIVIMDICKHISNKIIWCGDFNQTPTDDTMVDILKLFVDITNGAPTIVGADYIKKIDYILCKDVMGTQYEPNDINTISGDLVKKLKHLLRTVGSDHIPVTLISL